MPRISRESHAASERILVLGGYGLIGTAVVRQLLMGSHAITAIGRNVDMARRRLPDIDWIAADLAQLTTEQAWLPLLRAVRPDVVVNCAGVLQDGLHDAVVAVHVRSVSALLSACTALGIDRIVQISAVGADVSAPTAFMRSKGEAEHLIRSSRLKWVILRPGLVLGAQAYGGSALLRALAAMPLVQPLIHQAAPIQTVSVAAVADAVRRAVTDEVPWGNTYDLVEDVPHRLDEIVHRFRDWLGFAPARDVPLPCFVGRVTGLLADGAGWLGWRSPLRTTTQREIARGVVGDPAPWRQITGASLASLEETLRSLPSSVQERWFTRAYLLKPLAIVTLSTFWVVSGIIGFCQLERAQAVLTAHGISPSPAVWIVATASMLDVIVGGAVLVKRAMPAAAWAMLALTFGYLAAGTWIAPAIWLDPLGPFLKALPATILTLFVLAFADDR